MFPPVALIGFSISGFRLIYYFGSGGIWEYAAVKGKAAS
jgi:hypothetical protein